MPRWALLLLLVLTACGGETATSTGAGGGGGGAGGAGGGDPEGITVADCGPDAAALPDGSCVPVGVSSCGEGFASDEAGGCEPVLPPSDCPLGSMKILGEPRCVTVAPCTGRWGQAPIDAGTVFVDAGYAGGGSDGSQDKPYTSLSTAVSLAPSGAVLAIAAGDYDWVAIEKPLQLWGACPAEVTIHGGVTAQEPVAIFVGAPDVELHALSVTDSAFGIVVAAPDARIEDVVIHDLINFGLYVDGDFAPGASAEVHRTAIVRTTGSGLSVVSGSVVIEDVYIADMQLYADGSGGRGLAARPTASAPTLSVDGLVIERSRVAGMLLRGILGDFERVYVGDTLGHDDGARGEGISVDDEPGNPGGNFPPDVQLDHVVVRGARFVGIKLEDAAVVARNITVRDVIEDPAFSVSNGHGINLLAWTEPTSLQLEGVLIEGVASSGLFVGSAGAANGGDAVATADISRAVVRDVAPSGRGKFGFGLYAQGSFDLAAQSTLTLRDALVERTAVAGIGVIDALLTVERAHIADTLASQVEGDFGDGVMVSRYFVGASPLAASLRQIVVADNARTGISVFGADVLLEDALLSCNVIHLNGESNTEGIPFTLEPVGDVRCGCATQEPCKVLSSGLAPPPVVD